MLKNQDTKPKRLSNKNKVKAWLLEGNTLNHKIARERWGMNYLPQRIQEVDTELQEDGIGFIRSVRNSNPKDRRSDWWVDYHLVRYTDADKVMRGDTK